MKLYWLATYGDLGLEVEHFTSYRAYLAAVRVAEKDHGHGELDSWTCGDLTLDTVSKVKVTHA